KTLSSGRQAELFYQRRIAGITTKRAEIGIGLETAQIGLAHFPGAIQRSKRGIRVSHSILIPSRIAEPAYLRICGHPRREGYRLSHRLATLLHVPAHFFGIEILDQ